MVVLALCIGIATSATLRGALGRYRRPSDDLGTTGLIVAGVAGLVALAAVAAIQGALPAVGAALLAALVLATDVRGGWSALRRRLSRAQSSTATPFQNAT